MVTIPLSAPEMLAPYGSQANDNINMLPPSDRARPTGAFTLVHFSAQLERFVYGIGVVREGFCSPC